MRTKKALENKKICSKTSKKNETKAVPSIDESPFMRYVKAELDKILSKCKDSDEAELQKKFNDSVYTVAKTFAEQDYSGFTASLSLSYLKRLLDYKPLSMLTGDDSEWVEVGKNVEQNCRCSSVFRENKDNGTAHYNDKYVVSDNGGCTWFHCGEKMLHKMGYTNRIQFPFSVPEYPTKLYIRYLKDVSIGEVDSENFIDITGNQHEILKAKELYLKKKELMDCQEKTDSEE